MCIKKLCGLRLLVFSPPQRTNLGPSNSIPPQTQTHTHTHAHTHTDRQTHTRTRTHKRTRTHTPSSTTCALSLAARRGNNDERGHWYSKPDAIAVMNTTKNCRTHKTDTIPEQTANTNKCCVGNCYMLNRAKIVQNGVQSSHYAWPRGGRNKKTIIKK